MSLSCIYNSRAGDTIVWKFRDFPEAEYTIAHDYVHSSLNPLIMWVGCEQYTVRPDQYNYILKIKKKRQ